MSIKAQRCCDKPPLVLIKIYIGIPWIRIKCNDREILAFPFRSQKAESAVPDAHIYFFCDLEDHADAVRRSSLGEELGVRQPSHLEDATFVLLGVSRDRGPLTIILVPFFRCHTTLSRTRRGTL